MMTIFDPNWLIPKEKLPEIGQRVKTIVVKEMIFIGDQQENSSMWKDDGEGNREIMFWRKLEEINDS